MNKKKPRAAASRAPRLPAMLQRLKNGKAVHAFAIALLRLRNRAGKLGLPGTMREMGYPINRLHREVAEKVQRLNAHAAHRPRKAAKR